MKNCRNYESKKNLTQEELAAQLYVSRTAISKWESGRGYPSIDSLKAISGFFSVSIDELLSGEELLTVSQQAQQQTHTRFRDQIFGLLDCAAVVLLFLPIFGQRTDDAVQTVCLFSLTEVAAYIRVVYCSAIFAEILWGISLLALQNWDQALWNTSKAGVSLFLNAATVALFLISRQPYAAALTFVLLCTKAFFLLKNR